MSIIVAVLLGAATVTAGLAAGAWEGATREEIKWSAAAIEDVRFVYLDEAPDAFNIAAYRNRSTVLETYLADADAPRDAVGGDLDRVAADARAAQETVEQTIFAREGHNRLIGEVYELPTGGYDIPRRLGAEREGEAEQSDAADLLQEGDRLNALAQALALLCVPIVILWVLVQAAAHTVGRSPGSTPPPEEVDLMPQPWLAAREVRGLAYASLTAWILLTLMPVVTLGMSAGGQRADADASRLAVAATTGLAAGNLQASLASNQAIASTHLSFAALSRQLTALEFGDEAEARLGEAEAEAADRWLTVTEPMTRMPTTVDGVDQALVQALTATLPQLEALRLEQNAAADRAAQAGNAVNLATLSIALAALSASALAFALVMRQAPTLVRVGGLAMLGGAVITAAASVIALV
ncbi:hypothetical protein ACLQ2Q_17910 [Microbacterium sp. DT81.1]